MKQKRKFGRKLLSFLLTLALAVGLMSGMGLTVYARTSISETNIDVYGSASGTVSSDMTCTNFEVFDSSTLTINQGVTVTLNNPEHFDLFDNSKIELHGTLAGSVGGFVDWCVNSYINVYLSDGAKYTVTGLTCMDGDNYLVYYGYDAATDGNGTVSVKNGSTDVTSASNGYKTTTYTFTATPSDGYKFKNWTKGAGGEVLGTDASINVTCEQNGQYQVYANFESDKTAQTITAADVTATYGDTGKSVSGTTTGDGAISYSVKSGDAVTVDENTGALTIVKAGSAVITVTAAETATYAQATKDVNVTVNTKAMTVSAENVNVTVDGQPHGITVNVTDPASAATVKYGTEVGTYNLDASPTQTEAGELTVYYQVTADNYTTYTGSAKVTVSAKSTQTINASDVTATFGDTGKKIEASTTGDGTLSYAVKSGEAVTVDESTGALTIVKIGSAVITVTATETATYAQAAKDVNVTVNKANAVATKAPTAKTLTYNGYEQELVTAGELTGGTMYYAVTTENTAPADSLYTTSIPTATDAGTYYVWYKVVGDDNHSDLEAACVAVTIAEQNRISYTVTFKVVNGSWNDEAADNKTVTLTGVEGEDLKLSEGDIPEVGAKPNDGYEEGSWDVVPSAGTVVTENKIYTYTYAETKSEPTPTPEPTPDPEPTPEPTPTPESGSIEVATSGDAGIEAPAISSEEAKSILEGTGINVSSTDDVKVIVESNTKSEADVQQDADRLKEELKDSDVTIGAYIDISVACIINGAAKNYINKTGSSIIFKVPVPSSLVASGRLYIVYRIHGGTVSIVGTSTTPVVPVSSDQFSTYAIGYTTASGEKNSESEIKPCVHTYQWSEDIHPTADTDGETYYKCTKCGHVLYKQTISAYSYFNTECCNRIRNAAANSKVVITTDKWISVHRSVIEELNKRKDVTLEVIFLEEGYKGNRMSFVIPAGSDVMPIIGEDNFVGFIYLGSNFGIKTSY